MIGIFNDNYPPIMDGVALTAQNYAQWLTNKGNEVCVVTPYAPLSSKFDNSAPYPVLRYASLPIPMRKPYRFGIPEMDWSFRRKLKKMQFHLVHAHCPFSSGKLALDIARKQKIPLIATFHSKYRQDFERVFRSKRMVDNIIRNIVAFYEQADEVWIPQASVEPTLREYGYKGHVEVMENGNDFATPAKEVESIRYEMREELDIKPHETVLLFVGQHIWEKNIGFILDALYLIQECPFHLFMVGTGYAAHKFQHQVEQLGLTEKVTMVGNIGERELLKKYYAAADLFLFPSLYDNAPLVVREAAALHTPSVLLDDSTAAEIITDQLNGFLSPNDVHEYAKRIKYLINHPQIVQRAGDNASSSISRSWENVVDEVLLRYKEIQDRHAKYFI